MNRLSFLSIVFLSLALVLTQMTLLEVRRNLADAIEALESYDTHAPSSYDTSTPGTTTPERLRGIDGRVYEIAE